MITGFGNNVVSSLASDITASQTTILVLPGSGSLFDGLLSSDFENPSNTLSTYAKLTLTDSKETAFEVCHLISVSNDALTVIRGQEGTTAKGWSLNDVIANFATRGSENQFVQIDHLQSGFYCAGVADGSADALMLHLPSSFFLNGSTDWMIRTPVVVYPAQDNTGAATLQLVLGGVSVGTFPLYKGDKAELVAGDVLKDVALVCLLDKTKTFFSVMNPGAIYAGLGTAAFHDVTTSHTDGTANRVLRVADFGLGGYGTDTQLAAPEDAKKPLRNGFYGVSDEPTYGNSAIISFGFDSGSQTHIIAKQGGQAPLLAICGSTPAGIFGNWGKIYTEFQKPTAAEVGAMPYFGTALNVDLNTLGPYGAAGIYYQPSNAGATTANNYPLAEAGSLEITPSAYGCQQEYTTFSSGRKFVRGLSGTWNGTDGPWNIWKEIPNKNIADSLYQPKGSYAGPNTASKAVNGWWQCGTTGIIIQWVQGGTVNNQSNQTVTFPKAFPNACYLVNVSTLNVDDSNSTEQQYQMVSKTNASCVVLPKRAYGSTGNVAPLIIAVGY